MRQQQNRRNKSRNNQNRKVQNPLSKVFDSSGPNVKVRGNAQNIYEKYMALARDAQTAGDYVVYENYAQHAEHYKRIIVEATPPTPIVEAIIEEPSPEQTANNNTQETVPNAPKKRQKIVTTEVTATEKPVKTVKRTRTKPKAKTEEPVT